MSDFTDIMGTDESPQRDRIPFPPSPFPVMKWSSKGKGSKTVHIGRQLKGVLVRRVEAVQKEDEVDKDNKPTGRRVTVFQPEKFRDGSPNPRHLGKDGKPRPKTYEMVFVLAKEIEGVPLPDDCFRTTSGLVVYRDYLQGSKRSAWTDAKKEAFGEENMWGNPIGMGVDFLLKDTESNGQGGERWIWEIAVSPVMAKDAKGYDAVARSVFEAYNAIAAYDEQIKAIIAANSGEEADAGMLADAHSGGGAGKAAWDEDAGGDDSPF